MWRGVRSVWLPAGAGGAGLGAYWATHRRQSSSSCEESREPQGDEKGPGFLGVFLDTKSVAEVLKLTTRSSPITLVPHAIIHLHPDPDTHHVFAPLCGAKVICAVPSSFPAHVCSGSPHAHRPRDIAPRPLCRATGQAEGQGPR
jgi:hypothetical protein